MTANGTTIESTSPHPAGSRPSRGRLILVWLLYAALAVQVAAWIAVVLTTRDIGAAFTKPHPGFRDEVVLGGGIWLIQFALVVLVSGRKARAGAHTDSHLTGGTEAA